MSNREKRGLDKEVKRVKNSLQSLERKIEEMESDVEKLELILADPEQVRKPENARIFHEHAEQQRKLEEFMMRWEKLGEELEGLNFQLLVEKQ